MNIERPAMVCGKCEHLCTEVVAQPHAQSGTILFTVNHHRRTYRKAMDQTEVAAIMASPTPAMDVCGWPQDISGPVELAEVANVGRKEPLLYCGKCDCRMRQHATEEHRLPNPQGDVTSRDFAVSCHGQMYVLNLHENDLWRMLGNATRNGDRQCNLQRLDVCDKNGKQYPHCRAIGENAKALEGTAVALGGMVFDPEPNVPQVPGPRPTVLPTPQRITAQTGKEMQAQADRSRAESHGMDLCVPISTPSGRLQATVLIAGQRHWWNQAMHRYTSFQPGGGDIGDPVHMPDDAAQAQGWRHIPDPATGLTPAATEGMMEIAQDMIRKRVAGGPVTDALRSLAGKLTPKVLDRLCMAANGTDLREMVTAFDGSLIARINEGGTMYAWNLPEQCYKREGAALAALPAPEPTAPLLPPGRSRRIVLED